MGSSGLDPGVIIAVSAFVWGVLVWLYAQRRLHRDERKIEDTNGRVVSMEQRVTQLEAELGKCNHDRDQYMRERDTYMRLYAQAIAESDA